MRLRAVGMLIFISLTVSSQGLATPPAQQQVLQSLDQQLIPAAQNAELKAYLQKLRGVVADHLQKAQQLQGQIR